MFTFHPAPSRPLYEEAIRPIDKPVILLLAPIRRVSPVRSAHVADSFARCAFGSASVRFAYSRPHDNDAGHPICLEKIAQFLFHYNSPAARRVTDEDSIAIAH